ncbi:MAG: tRNA lysidine(34) synthetase TilS [Hyphomicrobiales bacterium]
MLERFKLYIRNNQLVGLDQKVLLAVSGGPDSVAMVDLFYSSGIEFGIAHCNFNLRGKESDDDELYVKSLAQRYRVPLFVKSFDTKKLSDDKGISIQMAARELRFDWFEEIIEKHKYNSIATAHHIDDGIETFFINLFRGTGIAGLRGILSKQGNIIHPLLFCTKEELIEYLDQKNIAYRSDSSNESDKYIRNKIRHHLLPVLFDIEPDIRNKMSDNFERLSSQEKLLSELVKDKINEIANWENNNIYIDIQKLTDFSSAKELLYHILRDYNFSIEVVEEIYRSIDSQSGKVFYSKSHQIIRDRAFFILSEFQSKKSDNTIYYIEESQSSIKTPIDLSFHIKGKDAVIDKNELISLNYAFLNLEKLVFPLKLRKWQQGDKFIPFGMKGSKKVSDFLIDNKLSLKDKEDIWILCDNNDRILWVVGHRIDNRFRVSLNRQNIFVIKKLN